MTNTLCHGQYEYSYRELGPNMNIHITWLTYVRTGPKKKIVTRASPGIARVKFWSVVHIAYHYIVLRDDGAESFGSKDNRQSKARRLGGGTGFFSTHKPTARAARAACPGNLAALKPPLWGGEVPIFFFFFFF